MFYNKITFITKLNFITNKCFSDRQRFITKWRFISQTCHPISFQCHACSSIFHQFSSMCIHFGIWNSEVWLFSNVNNWHFKILNDVVSFDKSFSVMMCHWTLNWKIYIYNQVQHVVYNHLLTFPNPIGLYIFLQ